jgi:monovalent cation/hydrogen antiporter
VTALLVVLIVGLAVIAASAVLGPRIGIASPLVLVAVGVAASLLPFVPTVQIEPEWILDGVLPPLLFSSAVSMPSMNFRREFGAISGLSVILVVASALVLGVFFAAVIPGLGFAWGVALGAIVSPTDAVATSIIKGTSVSKRVVAMLDGESLLNDATALVLLRTAIFASAVGFSFWGAVGTFAYSVAVAVAIGGAVGVLNLLVRHRISDPTVNTVISFAIPFAAAVPTEALGASGLVAAVVAGLVTGVRAPRDLSPRNRLSESQNWRTAELVLEGVVFLTMGLQIQTIITAVEDEHSGVGLAVLIAAGALLLTILVRAAYVVPLLFLSATGSRRGTTMQPRLQGMQERMATPEGQAKALERMQQGRKNADERDLQRFMTRIRRGIADIDYFVREPLGWREGSAVVWAGMRGAVTVAAAQTLPTDGSVPDRPVLVLIAFSVAALSLLVQGGSIGPLMSWLAPKKDPDAVDPVADAERTRLMQLLRETADAIPAPSNVSDLQDYQSQDAATVRTKLASAKEHRLAILTAQRNALLDARDDGTFDADVLAYVLANLDAEQIALEMRGGPQG